MPATRPSPKERARRAVDDLPDDATYEDVIARLVVVHKIERGRAEVTSGEGLMSQAEVEARFALRRAGHAALVRELGVADAVRFLDRAEWLGDESLDDLLAEIEAVDQKRDAQSE